MKIHREIAQGSLDWFNLRAGVVTASEMDRLITPAKLEAVKGKGFQTYLAEKLAEKWCGPLPGANTWDMEQGTFLESEARPAFTVETGIAVESVGFVTTDDGRTGCSPDAAIFCDGRLEAGVEIKCPLPQTQIKYLLAGELPPDYAPQVHGSMLVTGASHWWFFAYRRRMPPLCLKVGRDAGIIAKMKAAIDDFLDTMDLEWARLCEMNGGPPRDWRVAPTRPTVQEPLPDNYDVPTP